MASRWMGAVALAAVLLVAGCNDTVENRGDQAPPSSTEPISSVTVSGEAERVTDVAAYAISDEQAREILRKCSRSGGIPGNSEDCAAVVEDATRDEPPVAPRNCSSTCLWVGLIAKDQRVFSKIAPNSPVCSGEESQICDVVVFSPRVAPPLPPTTTNGTTSTEPTSPPTSEPTSPSTSTDEPPSPSEQPSPEPEPPSTS
ncbi:hypothetical protein FB561_0116 [Kribbella amoyensis]|uniref:Uncharacterized protein n=1 Tax=Kribbella amoyensis TaxID=996641 RepID=A0A561BJL7_9ACTN|nr:hypothetical protein FB561_0116 [Kribbella amoyensis]